MIRTRVTRLLLLLLVLLGALWAPAAPAGKRPSAPGEPSIVVEARAVASRSRPEATAILEEYLGGSPNPALVPWVELNAGEIRRLSGDFEKARHFFVRLRDEFPEHELHEAALLGIAMVDAGETPSGNQLATMALLDAPGAPPSLDADRWRLLALDASSHADEAKAKDCAQKAIASAAGDAEVTARVMATIRKIPAALSLVPPPTVPLDPSMATLERLRLAMEQRDFALAKKIAETYIATFPESRSVGEARYALARIEKGDPVRTDVVGVLLPLSGEYMLAGERLKEMISMANENAPNPITLVFRDEGGTPEKAVAALQSLVTEHGAIAVLGPLLKESSKAAAEVAQSLRVPLVTFSPAEGLTTDRDFVFRGFMTPEQQVRALVEHVMVERKLTDFAVLAPDNPFGHNVAETFSTEVISNQAPPPRVVYYDPSQADFRRTAQELACKDPKARAGELARLRAIARARGANPDTVVLPPSVSFDAILIPDAANRVALVASALAYEEFAIGTFRPKYDSRSILVMGLNGWHDDHLATDGGKYVRGGIFVDAFDPHDASPSVSAFVAAATPRLQETPGVVEAMAFDATRLVLDALAHKPTSRESCRNLLVQARLADPVAQGASFNERREIDRQFLVFVVGSQAVERFGGFEPAPMEPE
jgi:branched-chain amino acid transport system substrate-binding protein